jgi:zinc transport system substrate-binding protein
MRLTTLLCRDTGYNKSLRLACLLLLLVATPVPAENTRSIDSPGAIVVTIKPLYSLVAQLTDGITTPVLLMTERQSPHHYSMRPSERRLLSDAAMIVWIGPQMESSLSKIIQQQHPATIFTAMLTDNLHLLNRRQKHAHDEDQPAAGSAELDKLDPHIWLSAHNAAAISRQLSVRLIELDPENIARYRQNLQQLLQKIEQTAAFIATTLKDSDQPFITFHDAFQYFEDENHLHYADSISFDEETGASLKHVRQIKTRMEEHHIQCLVYQQPKPAIIDALSRQSTVTATALDPLGLNAKNDKDAWFEIMRQLAQNFQQCLRPAQQ